MRVTKTTESFKVMVPCDLCGSEFQFGPQRYAGRKVVAWDVMVCESCDKMNWDGLDPHRHSELMDRLRERGVYLELFPGGFMKIPGQGS